MYKTTTWILMVALGIMSAIGVSGCGNKAYQEDMRPYYLIIQEGKDTPTRGWVVRSYDIGYHNGVIHFRHADNNSHVVINGNYVVKELSQAEAEAYKKLKLLQQFGGQPTEMPEIEVIPQVEKPDKKG